MKRKEREMNQRREEMLQAAKELILEKGYENITMDQIAKKSEFTRITLYSYFKNKYDIASIIFYREIYIHFKRFSKKIEIISDSREILFTFGVEYYKFFNKLKSFHKFVFYLESLDTTTDELSEYTLELREKFTKYSREVLFDIFNNGKEKGELKKLLDIDIAIDVFWKSIFAIIHTYVFHDNINIKRMHIEIEYLINAFIEE